MSEDRTDGETAAERDGVWGSQRRASSMASMIFCFRGESGLEPDADGSTRPVEVPGWPRRDVGAVSNTDRLVGEVEIMLDGRPRYIWRFFGVWASSEGESDASSRVRFPRAVGVRGMMGRLVTQNKLDLDCISPSQLDKLRGLNQDVASSVEEKLKDADSSASVLPLTKDEMVKVCRGPLCMSSSPVQKG